MAAKKVQKKNIRYWKTPVEPVNVKGTCMFEVKFEGGRGEVPKILQGQFTSKLLCQKAIDAFMAKHTVEYID